MYYNIIQGNTTETNGMGVGKNGDFKLTCHGKPG